MVEINGQVYEEGDVVHFERATLPVNRQRDYEITALVGSEIVTTTTVGDNAYEHRFSREAAAHIGITHAHRTA
ncbi:hypothetical protein ACGFZR_15340 [Streptomyces sp. NPDC048241]|uniref:hypothetical protein n=1 Tax=Streptomyces sp. NPDC048241 TaxID=3365521 RepID=UPI0037215F88